MSQHTNTSPHLSPQISPAHHSSSQGPRNGTASINLGRLSGTFNAPTEAEIRSTKKHKGWRRRLAKLKAW
ncbi:hypothetical protein EJ04DRAFT_509750 [Polyplosphaeria fusca]|uniref:Uncharacterized protein n=1 Tax=Polyplosphaeria fusca TaxID=682080 RepID=A0A9P4V696_9PLEO|nr:hypothetical protein EJ04DRAFT_509750 [Polyplosphaeria fusca]